MMAKINSVLEKKLEELESLLEVVTSNYDDPNIRKLQLGILFATTLLTAETSSRRKDVEGEEDVEELFKLRCMANRLSEMEAFITNLLPGHGNGSFIKPVESLETNDGNGETGVDYSLVESCLNESKAEEEEEEEEDLEAEQRPLFQDATSEEVTFPAVATVKEEVVVREVEEKGCVGFRALVCIGLIGLFGCVMSLVGYIGDCMEEDQFLLTPT
ncbi:unnamed protein product [Arabidopsis lyrata]|uniref:Predicted protein n=1 Tax=Arabidopsis lyrata subsp. lyrata TaxID=81972 RepID=D7LND1_ARALL|nr:uncharacterized protein LOC9311907 [Arabidopsis lyrata subsp. lyrata]EFH53816.1 predicted protein [Arabidopsis lyrata subsp. lyrata]CAH8267761.1 unnamed protein product [Arabidopsis lyrata]|eukprot:XP_002877557.1 uncharacterized protein LOC9311907 [Arabidopsis lyrata subsp. lyrata]